MLSYNLLELIIILNKQLEEKTTENKQLQNLISQLIYENEELRYQIKEKEKDIINLNKSLRQTLNDLLKEKESIAKLNTWQKIVDEMAHSINTDVFAALSNLKYIPETIEHYKNVKKAIHNITRIRDIANLIMWDLNKERLPEAKELHKVNLEELINSQISIIKDGIDSLRLSIREHKDKLSKIEIPIEMNGDCIIEIDDNIEAALELILKDLLRNAFQNTDEENPEIKIEINEFEFFVKIKIINNRLISDEQMAWYNAREEDYNEDIQMSKSAKVGLRLVKKWCKTLNIESYFEVDKTQNQTTIILKIPKLIRYEKV